MAFGAKRDTVPSIQSLSGIADNIKWEAPLVGQEFGIRRMEDHDLSYAGSSDLILPRNE